MNEVIGWARPASEAEWSAVKLAFSDSVLVLTPEPDTGGRIEIDLRLAAPIFTIEGDRSMSVVEITAPDIAVVIGAPYEFVDPVVAATHINAHVNAGSPGAGHQASPGFNTGAMEHAQLVLAKFDDRTRRPTSKKGLAEALEELLGALRGLGYAEVQQLAARAAAINTELAAVDQRIAHEYQQRRSAMEYELSGLVHQVESARAGVVAEVSRQRAQVDAELARSQAHLAELQRQIAAFQKASHDESARLVAVKDELILQEAGIYEFRHRLADAVNFKAQIASLRERIKGMARKDGGAITKATGWTVNGSEAEGRKMVDELSKLMLRAYNSEADRLVATMRPYKLDSAVDRLQKANDMISRLGRTMSIAVSPAYHQLRVQELELTADYLAKVEEEKEAEREEKQRLREEAAARREFEAEKTRLRKEQAHYVNAIARLRENGDLLEAEKAEAKLAEIGAAIAGVESREANHRAGYVYVISNIGSFGPDVVKIGMTRRLDPMDRVRELGDASVPFRFDAHAVIFSEDAVSLEGHLHAALADRRVNLVNQRREFFYATPVEVQVLLERFDGSLLEFREIADAEEWHQSHNSRQSASL